MLQKYPHTSKQWHEIVSCEFRRINQFRDVLRVIWVLPAQKHATNNIKLTWPNILRQFSY